MGALEDRSAERQREIGGLVADSSSQDAFLQFFRPQFFQESEEMLEGAETLLLELENDPDSESGFQELFRIFHTLKGNAGMAHEDSIQSLCHIYENRLDAIRTGADKPAGDFFEEALKIVDLLRYAVSNQNPPQIRELLWNEVHRLKSPGGAEASTVPEVEAEVAAPAAGKSPPAAARPEIDTDPRGEFEIWLEGFRRAYLGLKETEQALSDRDAQGLFGLCLPGPDGGESELVSRIGADFPRLRSAALAFGYGLKPLERCKIPPGNEDFEDLQQLFLYLAEAVEEDLGSRSWFRAMPMKRLRDFKAFQAVYRQLPSVVFVKLSIPYERLIMDATAFDILHRISSDPNHWISFIFSRTDKLGKAAALLEWGLGDKASVFYSGYEAARILLEDRDFAV
jgi:two-component system chemotaxis sensor kinase CheA